MSKVRIKSNDLVQSAIAKASYYDNMTLRDERVGLVRTIRNHLRRTSTHEEQVASKLRKMHWKSTNSNRRNGGCRSS